MKIDNKMMKTLTTIFMKSKKTIIDHAPQIMAVAGCGCFMAATYCAVKETPKALEKLEEKKALDPDMSVLQKAAVLVPEFKGCISFTTLGLGLSFGAWKIESIRFAEMSAVAAAALKDNERLIDAAKSVVGEEETKKIVEKKDELTAEDCKVDYNGAIPSDQIVYPFLFDGGRECWMTLAKYKMNLDYCIRLLATNKELSEYEYFSEMGLRCPTSDMQKTGWQISEEDAVDPMTPDDMLDWAYEKLDASLELVEYDKRTKMPGYRVIWDVKPKVLKDWVTG